jgi:transposase InsO family protein
MDQRVQFIAEWLKGEQSVAQLCGDFGISRKSGYKWIERYNTLGAEGLHDLSRAPRHHAWAVDPDLERAIIELRSSRPTWGPRKLLWRLKRNEPQCPWPCASTVSAILARTGLSAPRKRKPHASPTAGPLSLPSDPNEVWAADFKGWFRTGDGRRCDPLTISDQATRFLIRCQALSGQTGAWLVQPIFEAAFRQYGLPRRIRTDNGAPFASTGLGGLTPLSVWWLTLGIGLERIKPGKPQQNGCHERMHRTLKAETAQPPATNVRAQQKAFDHFGEEYNYERPHEGLDMQTPGSLYRPSDRTQLIVREPEYPDDWDQRRVRGCGQMKWGGHDIRVTAALVGHAVGLAPIGDGLWLVYFFDHCLGTFDERKRRIDRPKHPTGTITTRTGSPSP